MPAARDSDEDESRSRKPGLSEDNEPVPPRACRRAITNKFRIAYVAENFTILRSRDFEVFEILRSRDFAIVEILRSHDFEVFEILRSHDFEVFEIFRSR